MPARPQIYLQEYCKDGCCYLFNPNIHPSLNGPGAIAGWLFFAVCLLFAICTVGYIWAFSALKIHKKWPFCGHVITTYIALSASFLTSGILLDLASHTSTQVSLSWSFAPSSVGKLGMALSSLMLVLTIGMSVAVTKTGDVIAEAMVGRLDNAENAASALVALIAVCLIPLVAGWDHTSGLAFTDQVPLQQTYLQNRERYDRLIALQGILLGLGISFVTKTLFQMLLKVVLG